MFSSEVGWLPTVTRVVSDNSFSSLLGSTSGETDGVSTPASGATCCSGGVDPGSAVTRVEGRGGTGGLEGAPGALQATGGGISASSTFPPFLTEASMDSRVCTDMFTVRRRRKRDGTQGKKEMLLTFKPLSYLLALDDSPEALALLREVLYMATLSSRVCWRLPGVEGTPAVCTCSTRTV